VILSFVFGLILATAGADFAVPPLTGPVVDQAGMLSSTTRNALDRFLRELHEQTGTQLQIATVPDLGGLSIEEASIQITDKWKLGKKKEDRGLLLLFAVKDRKVRIEVGQGLEGQVPDVVANRIIREVIVPRMRENAPDRAAIDGVMALVHYTDPDFTPSSSGVPMRSHRRHSSGLSVLVWILFFIFFWLFPLFSRRRRGGIFYWGGGGWGGGSGGWGDGGGWGGGSSGGGWSGGGGGFSGGGSSGSW
jgi:uncharacterized protein